MFDTGVVGDAVAGLSAAVSAAPAGVSSAEWVELVGDCQQLVNTLAAVQTVALARLAALEDVEAEDGTLTEADRGLGHQRLDAPALVSDLLGLTDAGAAARVEHAVRLCSRIPALVGAMRSGVLDSYRAAVVCEELAEADSDVCAAVMDVLGPQLGSEPAGALRRRVRRVLARVAPDLVRVKAARARTDRALRRWTHQAGVDEWSGTFPVEQARPAWAVIDKLAKAYLADGRCATLDQARAEALMDLIHGRARGTYLLQVAISATDLAHHTTPHSEHDELVEVSGLGIPGITHVSRAWLDSLPGAPFTTHTRATTPEPASAPGTGGMEQPGDSPAAACLAVNPPAANANRPTPARSSLDARTLDAFVQSVTEVAVCDPATGALLGRLDRPGQPGPPGRRGRRAGRTRALRARGGGTSPGYTPPAWMAALVKARDGGCRFPGCTTGPRFCDLDHVTAWPTGPTAAWNLISLCRRHHRIKQRRGWAVHLAPDGTTTWTDPTGRVRTTTPQNLLSHPRTAPVPATVVPVDPATVRADHPIAFGIQASHSTLEEELDLTLMLTRHQDTERRRDRSRHARTHQVAALDDDRPPPRCRTRSRHDVAHPSILRTWTFEHRPDHRPSTTRHPWPTADDPPPF